jgi:hypothetical protein
VTEPSTPAPDGGPATPVEEPAADEISALDVDGVGAVAVGTVLWTVALVLCLVLRGPLTDAGRGWWTWVCLTGALLGAAGYMFVRRRRDAYAAAHTDIGPGPAR